MFFAQVVGQDKIKERLKRLANANRIAHASLFTGKEGYGALPMALAYVRYLYCTDKGEDACGKCASCLKMNNWVHPDVSFLYPVATTKKVKSKPTSDDFIQDWREFLNEHQYPSLKSWEHFLDVGNKQPLINVHQASEIARKLSLKSFEGGYKTAIIWLPELMNGSAANKLLKLLEEPPEKTLFILVAESIENMLPTVISRTQQTNFPPIKTQDLANWLESTQQLEKSKAVEFSVLSEGNVNDALELLHESSEDQLIRESFTAWMRLLIKRNIPDLLEWSDKVHTQGREWQKNLLRYALHIFRESLISNLKEESLQRSIGEELKFITNFSPFVPTEKQHELQQLISEAIYGIERNGYAKIIFSDLSLKLVKVIPKR